MKKSIIVAILFFVGIPVLAYVMTPLTETQLQKASQLMVVGTVTKVRELNETNSTIWSGSCKLRGLEATFTISKVLKGDFTNSTVVLHYYRWDTPGPTSDEGSTFGTDIDAPGLIFLTPSDTNQFKLYLVKDGASRYAPASGQLYYAYESVRVLRKSENLGVIHVSDGKPNRHTLADGRVCSITPTVLPDGTVILTTTIITTNAPGIEQPFYFYYPIFGRAYTLWLDNDTALTVTLNK